MAGEASEPPPGARLCVMSRRRAQCGPADDPAGVRVELPPGEHALEALLVTADGACALPTARVRVACNATWVEGGMLCLAGAANGADAGDTDPRWLPGGAGPPAAGALAALPRWLSGSAARLPPAGGPPVDPVARQRGRDAPPDAISAVGTAHLEAVGRLVADVVRRGVPGDTAVVDAQGGGAVAMVRAALGEEGSARRTYVTLGPPSRVAGRRRSAAHWGRSQAQLKRALHTAGVSTPEVLLVAYEEGQLLGALAHVRGPLAFARVASPPRADCAGVGLALHVLYPRMSPGGVVLVDHLDDAECRRELAGFRAAHGVRAPLRPLGVRAGWWLVGVGSSGVVSDDDDGGGEWQTRVLQGNGVAGRTRAFGPDPVLDAGVQAAVRSGGAFAATVDVRVGEPPAAAAARLRCPECLPQLEAHWLQAFMVAAAAYQESLFGADAPLDDMEGHICAFRHKALAVARVARRPEVRHVCEIGFNCGHSALLYLLANPRARVTAFDLGEHWYARVALERLQRMFPGRLEVHFGDSRETVPRYRGPACDVLSVDGGHEGDVPLRDLQHMRALAAPGRDHVLLVDDALEPDVRGALRAMGAAVEVEREVFSVFNSCWRVLGTPGGEMEPCESFDAWLMPEGADVGSSLVVGRYT